MSLAVSKLKIWKSVKRSAQSQEEALVDRTVERMVARLNAAQRAGKFPKVY
jgi:hypothetical protein